MKQLLLIFICFSSLKSHADKYLTKTGKISFYSDAPLEKIEAHNRAVGVLLNTENSALNFSVLIKSFVFQKKLMQEHFNENYLESNKYPKAKFDGTISNLSSINFEKDGSYKAQVSGKLTIHGVTRTVTETGNIIIRNGQTSLKASFNISLTDYKVKIPSAVKDKISNTVKIDIDADLKKI